MTASVVMTKAPINSSRKEKPLDTSMNPYLSTLKNFQHTYLLFLKNYDWQIKQDHYSDRFDPTGNNTQTTDNVEPLRGI